MKPKDVIPFPKNDIGMVMEVLTRVELCCAGQAQWCDLDCAKVRAAISDLIGIAGDLDELRQAQSELLKELGRL